ncbi:hypothetical protein Q0P11_14290, partial [Staphylococcus aureus]|nr:hypothetical protein [Staphylococcus aureus]
RQRCGWGSCDALQSRRMESGQNLCRDFRKRFSKRATISAEIQSVRRVRQGDGAAASVHDRRN